MLVDLEVAVAFTDLALSIFDFAEDTFSSLSDRRDCMLAWIDAVAVTE